MTRHPDLTFQLARNLPEDNPIVKLAKAEWSNGLHKEPWLLWHNRPARGSACTMTIPSQGGSVNQVAYSPDGSIIAAAHADGAVRLWVATTGDTHSTLQVPDRAKREARCLDFRPADR